MKGFRHAGVLLTISGGLLTAALVKMFAVPGLVEFAFVTLAHLLLAAAVFILSVTGFTAPVLRWTLAAVWGLGWLLFHTGEIALLVFVSPPAWISLAATALIFTGGLFAVILTALPGVKTAGEGKVLTVPAVAVFAVLSAAPLWTYLLVAGTFDPSLAAGYWVRVAGDVAAAGSISWFGMRLLRGSRSDQVR